MKLNWVFGLAIILAIFNIVYAYDDEEIDIPSKDKTSQFIMTVTSTKTIPKTATKTIPTNSVEQTTTIPTKTIPTKTIPISLTETTLTYTYREPNWERWNRVFDRNYHASTHYTKLPENVDSAVMMCNVYNAASKERPFKDVICNYDNECYSSYTDFESSYTYDRATSTSCCIYTSKTSDPTPTESVEPEFICTPVQYLRTYVSSSIISNEPAKYKTNGETEYFIYRTKTYTASTYTYTSTSCVSEPTDVVYSTKPVPSGYKVTTINHPFGDNYSTHDVPIHIMTIPENIKSMDAKCITTKNVSYTLPGKVSPSPTKYSKTVSNVQAAKTISNVQTSTKAIPSAQKTSAQISGKTLPNTQTSTTSSVKPLTKTISSTTLKRYENGYYDQNGNYYSFYTILDRVDASITRCDLYTYQESKTPTVEDIPTMTLYQPETYSVYYTGWKNHLTTCNYKTNEITSKYFTTTLTMNAITEECTTISTIGTYTSSTIRMTLPTPSTGNPTTTVENPEETTVSATTEIPEETTVIATTDIPEETTVIATTDIPEETTVIATTDIPEETTVMTTIKESPTTPISTPSTKCLPIVITVTEKDITTITEKETITVTVTDGSIHSNTPEDDSHCSSKWAQCGGIGFNGPTCCKSGSTCHKLNEYYSQCI